MPVGAGRGRGGFPPDRFARIGPAVPFAVARHRPGASGQVLALNGIAGNRAEVRERPGRRVGSSLLAQVDGALVHECREFAQVAVDLRVIGRRRPLGVADSAGRIRTGKLADPRVQDLGNVVRAAPAAGVVEGAQVPSGRKTRHQAQPGGWRAWRRGAGRPFAGR